MSFTTLQAVLPSVDAEALNSPDRKDRRVRFSPIKHIHTFMPILDQSESWHRMEAEDTRFPPDKFLKKVLPFVSYVNKKWVFTDHGAVALAEHDLLAIDTYTELVRKQIIKLERAGKIRANVFHVPTAKVTDIHQTAVIIHTAKIRFPTRVRSKPRRAFNPMTGESFMINFSEDTNELNIRQILDALSADTPEKEQRARWLAREISEIIWASGFADAHLGNILPNVEDGREVGEKWSFVDCKPFGLYDELEELQVEAIPHNGRIGLEKFLQCVQHYQLGHMAEEVQRFLDEHPHSEEDCIICQRVLLASS